MRKSGSKAEIYSTTISSKGQIVLPAPLRARLGLARGMRLNIIFSGKRGAHLVLRPATPALVRRLRGSVPCAAAALEFLTEERKRDRERGR